MFYRGRTFHTGGVTGSKPVSPTNLFNDLQWFAGVFVGANAPAPQKSTRIANALTNLNKRLR